LTSTGEIIGFLNSQDYYLDRNVIQKIVNVFINKQEVGIVYGKTYYVPMDSTEIVGVMGERFKEKRMGLSESLKRLTRCFPWKSTYGSYP